MRIAPCPDARRARRAVAVACTIRSTPRGAPRDARVAGTPLRGPSPWPWIPAFAGMSGRGVQRLASLALMLRSRAAQLAAMRGVSKHGGRAAPSFETRAAPAPQDEAAPRMPASRLIAEPLA